MTHLHRGRPCITCTVTETAATLAKHEAQRESRGEWLFLTGLSLLALLYLLT